MNTERTPGRTSRGEETRRRIRDVALELFRRDGYEKTTMRTIASEAGVAIGNAYYYFSSKEELVQGFYRQLVESHVAASHEILEQHRSLEDRLREVVLAKIELAAPYHDFSAVLFATAANPSSSLSPFSDASRDTRASSLELFRTLAEGSRERLQADLAPVIPDLLWLYQMGIILYWIHDRSEASVKTQRLIATTCKLISRTLGVLKLPGTGGVRKLIVAAAKDMTAL